MKKMLVILALLFVLLAAMADILPSPTLTHTTSNIILAVLLVVGINTILIIAYKRKSIDIDLCSLIFMIFMCTASIAIMVYCDFLGLFTETDNPFPIKHKCSKCGDELDEYYYRIHGNGHRCICPKCEPRYKCRECGNTVYENIYPRKWSDGLCPDCSNSDVL